jgi:hypothetical protein
MTIEASPQGEYRPTNADELSQEAARLYYEESSDEYNQKAFLFTTRFSCPPVSLDPIYPSKQDRLWRSYANEQYEIANGEPSPLRFKRLETWRWINRIVAKSFTAKASFSPTSAEDLIRAVLDRDGRVVFKPTYDRDLKRGV